MNAAPAQAIPYNNEMERAVIGAFLLQPAEIIEWSNWVQPEDFDDTDCEAFLTAQLAVFRRTGEPPDEAQVNQELLRTGAYDRLRLGVGHMLNACVSVDYLPKYADVVIENAITRALGALGTQLGQGFITLDEHRQKQEKLHARMDAYRAWRSGDGADDAQAAVPENEAKPFPVDVLPKAFQRLVIEGAAAIHCPPDFLAVPLLVLAGVAIGNSRCIEIKRTWHERARIWAAVVAHPGEKKSPALDLVSEPFYRRQRELEALHRQHVKDWEENPNPEKGAKPKMEQVFTSDATLEALVHVLGENPRGVLFWRDELTGWARAMNQYKAGGKGSDRQNWLSLWNGAPVIVNRRAQQETLSLHDPFVGVIGALPPDVLGELSDERGREDGFIHRILFAYPQHMPRVWTDTEMPPETMDTFVEKFNDLWKKLAPRADEYGTRPVVLRFTPEGKREWSEFITDHYAETEDPHFPMHLQGPWAKLEGYTARLALILHLCRFVCGEVQSKSEEIDEISMAGAADLADYFKSHIRRVYAELHARPEDLQAVVALNWMRRQDQEQISSRDLQRAGLKGITSAQDAKRVLWDLKDRGHGIATEVPSKGGKKVVFRFLHPTVDRKAPGSDTSGTRR